MKIKVFVVTYNNKLFLNNCLKNLFDSDLIKYEYEINVINNHSIIEVNDEYVNRINVLNNALRPDFSCGHLSRNWNQALLNGFKNIDIPDCDICVAVQEDTIFLPEWAKTLVDLHKKYSFISYGWGDNFMSWTIDGVKSIGLFDERFCGLQYQGADYFLRALKYNAKRSSVNDHFHGRVYNREDAEIAKRSDEVQRVERGNTFKSFAIYNDLIWSKKYPEFKPGNWSEPTEQKNKDGVQYSFRKSVSKDFLNKLPESRFPQTILYPYFERDIQDLDQKGYLVPDQYLEYIAMKGEGDDFKKFYKSGAQSYATTGDTVYKTNLLKKIKRVVRYALKEFSKN